MAVCTCQLAKDARFFWRAVHRFRLTAESDADRADALDDLEAQALYADSARIRAAVAELGAGDGSAAAVAGAGA